MPTPFAPNTDPRYYARPAAYRCQIGAAAVGPAVPAASALGGAQAAGSFTFSSQPSPASTITIFGVAITFAATGFDLGAQPVSGTLLSADGVPLSFQAVGQTGLQVKIAGTLAATLANLLGLLRSWPDYALAPGHFTLSGGNTLAVQARDPGTGGNGLTIAAGSGSNATPSGATLSGGTALVSGVGCLVPATNHPTELQSVYAMGRANIAAGSVVLGLTDGMTVNVVDWLTHASQSAVSATQGNARLPFPSITASTPLIVPPGLALMSWSTIAQAFDVVAPAGGSY